MKIYIFDEDMFAKLRAVAAHLCGGSDKMRDEGNKLDYLLSQGVILSDQSHDWDDESTMRCTDCGFSSCAGNFEPDTATRARGIMPRELPAAEVRHGMHGYYVCTRAEADHEDEGNPSAGFDGRDHYATEEEAKDALTRWYAENDDDVMIDPAPSIWASYLINGDASGLDDVDHRACDLHCETQWDGWCVVNTIGESYFSWSYHMHGGTAQGGDLIEYVLHRVKKEG